MIKALWFMIKIALFAALALWLVEQPGMVEIEWLNYDVRIHMGLFLISVLGLILISIFIYNVIKTFVDFPKSYRRYSDVKRIEKGYKALTMGLSAVAAGDSKLAAYQSHRANKLLEGDKGLPVLLKAQAARMQGDEAAAQDSFTALLENKDTAFLGARGLLQAALDAEDYDRALETAHKALKIQPRQPWILKIVYDLEIRLKHWLPALDSLAQLEKYSDLTKADAARARIALLHARGDALALSGMDGENADDADSVKTQRLRTLQKAHAVDKSFAPSIVRLAVFHHQNAQRRKAVRLIEKSWKSKPHRDLARCWVGLMSQDKASKPLGAVQWMERLLKLNASSAAGYVEAGRIATEAGLWGEARSYFERAQMIEPSAQLCQMRAALEEKAGAPEDVVQEWLDKAVDAPTALGWVCGQTGRIYEDWSPVAMPHGSFNTIEWRMPNAQAIGVEALEKPALVEAVLEAPRKMS